jgi:hypothetical protein
MRTSKERTEAKMSEIKTDEKMDDGQEEMKAQVGSLASQIDASQERTIAEMDSWPADMRAWRNEMEVTGLPGE